MLNRSYQESYLQRLNKASFTINIFQLIAIQKIWIIQRLEVMVIQDCSYFSLCSLSHVLLFKQVKKWIILKRFTIIFLINFSVAISSSKLMINIRKINNCLIFNDHLSITSANSIKLHKMIMKMMTQIVMKKKNITPSRI